MPYERPTFDRKERNEKLLWTPRSAPSAFETTLPRLIACLYLEAKISAAVQLVSCSKIKTRRVSCTMTQRGEAEVFIA
jgi:hypothetical protein